MNKSLIIFIFIISSCNNQTEVRLIDLKFPSPDKDGVLTNLVDSTILVSEYNSRKDTIGLITYDSVGHILYDGRQYDTYKYQYDSFGLVQRRWWRDWDVYLEFEASYDYYPDSLLLVQHWTGDYPYTTRFKFDSNGYLIEESTDDPGNRMHVRRGITIYEYNNDHELVNKKETILYESRVVEQTNMSVFYTNRKIDSIVTIINSDRWGLSKIVDHYYTNGLKKLTLKQEQDEELQKIEYIHKSKREQ